MTAIVSYADFMANFVPVMDDFVKTHLDQTKALDAGLMAVLILLKDLWGVKNTEWNKIP